MHHMIGKWLRGGVVGIIKLYQYLISPLFGASCRFEPTCSSYMIEAIDKHGLLKGLILGVKRLSCCHPWCKSHGHDPVPEELKWSHIWPFRFLRAKTNKKSG